MLIEKCNITFSKFSQKVGGQNGGQCPVVVKGLIICSSLRGKDYPSPDIDN